MTLEDLEWTVSVAENEWCRLDGYLEGTLSEAQYKKAAELMENFRATIKMVIDDAQVEKGSLDE